MNYRLSSHDVYDQAALWAARADAGSLTSDDQNALDAWLAADSRHFGAFAQASALLQATPGEVISEISERDPKVYRRRAVLGGAVAAGLAVTVGGGLLAVHLIETQRYHTEIGELRVIPLSDGSVVSLNTNSEIAVHYSKERRAIELIRGEALFDVAKNKQIPFIVEAANTQVRAVGTSFTVKLLPDQPVQVLVREGIVEVKRPDVPVAPVVQIAKNTRAIAPADAPIVAQPVETADVTRELAWRMGRIAFHGETLGEAAAEFARYSDIRIDIDDPAIAQEKVTGLFVSADPVGFAKAVAVSFDLHAEVSEKEVRITR